MHDLAMAIKHRYPYAGGIDTNPFVTEQAAHFALEPQLLKRIALLGQRIDLRNQVEGNLCRIDTGLNRTAVQQLGCLPRQLLDPRLAGAGDRLQAHQINARYPYLIMDRFQRQHQLSNDTGWTGHDITLTVIGQLFTIDLGDHQRHIVIGPIVQTVVDDDATRLGG